MSFKHYIPDNIINVHDENYISIQKLQELISLRHKIGLSLIDTCVKYIGLHKLINFDELEYELSLLFKALFTNYQSKIIIKEWMSWLPELENSIKEDYFNELKLRRPDLIIELVNFINELFNHYKVINHLLNNRITFIEYQNIYGNEDFSDNYPFIVYEEAS